MPRSLIRLAPELAMPLEAVTQTFGIFGLKGSGKSSTVTTFVEQGVAVGGRYVIADPTGVWWGLMHDGTGPGLSGIVFGGEHGDVPLEPTAGHVVAEFVVQQEEYPVVVLDLSLMRKADRTKFMLDFLETLYHENREALHVVLDEAHQFAPTQAREGGNTIPLLGAVEDVVALGRKRGLGISMISQRFATLNANVREQIGTLIAHQLTGALDRKALKGWIEAQADPAREKEVLDEIAKFSVGQALVWSPSFLKFFGIVNVNEPVTFDSRATPKVGQRVKKPGKRAPVNLDVLRQQMAATIEEAEANDPKLLKNRIAKAETFARQQALEIEKLNLALESRPPETTTVTVEVPVIDSETMTALQGHVLDIENAQERIVESYEKLREFLYPLGVNVRDWMNAEQIRRLPSAPRVEPTPRQPPAAPSPEAVLSPQGGATEGLDGTSNGTVTNPEQRVLDAIRWYGLLGNERPTKQQVGFIAGYRVGKNVGGTFANVLGKLRSAGYIDYPTPGTTALTSEGRVLARDPGIEATNEAVQQAVRTLLKPAEIRVLDVLVSSWPHPLEKAEVGRRSGYSVSGPVGGTFANILGRLRNTLGVIEYPSPGEARAADVLFPLG